ncbi:ABC transporter ATP-binding protein [Scytonema hofmannii PCC 7110]|uniref:ABC transporter ATP-binding protein n=1 Tax=Scytonema hofmannii PCC 7110 TaxID=128403 RepID=A0A139X0J1_9CYAN|nr:ATP-binding cassette domain-containing protein [Scytonema hofmannii]KYC38214.1 ABC transporter ATP-binding protein [Scytonema hofmannii PCC 7110]
MNVIYLLLNSSRIIVAIAIFAGLVSGACSARIIALINSAINSNKTFSSVLIWSFIGLVLIAVTSRFISELCLIRLSQKVIFDTRLLLCRRIVSSPLRYIEELGSSRLLATLTDDVQAVSDAVAFIPSLCIAIAVVLGCLVYLIYLSWIVFLGFVVFLVTAILSYEIVTRKAKQSLELARAEQDKLFSHFHAITEGIKELKLNQRRREAFFAEELECTIGRSRRYNIDGMTSFTIGLTWSQLLLFTVIGLVDFGLPRVMQIDQSILSGYALTIIFLVVALDAITTILPRLSKASIALQKIESMNLALASRSEEMSEKSDCVQASTNRIRGYTSKTRLRGLNSLVRAGGLRLYSSELYSPKTSQTTSPVKFEQLKIENLSHAYCGEQEDNYFTLGSIDLTFFPKELVFLVGGNGSGKSTFAKLITGLYISETGKIFVDGKLVDDQNRDWYRQHFSAVFSDFYLFDKLLGLDCAKLDNQIQDYLVKLHLDSKVKVKEGKFSTTALSQGQRKRLALLTAYLEDRPFYVFDEWASDQDPVFKEIFYTQLLPELKSKGKTVLAISHDDRYFHLADRILKLDYGKLI